MRAVRPVLSVLLALVLLAQTGMAAAHCLATALPAGHATEICSPEGARIIRVAEDGTALPEAPPRAGPGFCAACPILAASVLPVPPVLSEPAWVIGAVATVPATTAFLRPAARAPPYAPRAPPAFA